MLELFGLGIPYNELSKPFSGNIRERFLPGAFSRSINTGVNIFLLSQHEMKYILGRTSSETLKIREDHHGVWFEAIPPDTEWVRGLINQIKRGDIEDVSFLFGPWEGGNGVFITEENGSKVFNRSSARLYEISIVTSAMYGGHVSVRGV